MNKNTMRIWLFTPIIFLIILVCLVFYMVGIAGSVVCFGVDSNDCLYVGFGDKIEVYEGKTMIRELSPKTSKSYLFTILPDDVILLTTASVDYKLNLDGSIIEKTENAGSGLYNDMQKGKRTFMSPNGDFYKMRSVLGQTTIEKNGDTVYQEPIISVITGYLILICSIALVVCVISILSRDKKG